MANEHEIDFDDTMIRQAKHYRMPDAPTPFHPQMKPVNLSQLIQSNRAKSLMSEPEKNHG